VALATSIASAVASAAHFAELMAERAERGELVDLGAYRQNAENLNEINVLVTSFKNAADAMDHDPAFVDLVRAHFEDDG
jgi:hypothetical protein